MLDLLRSAGVRERQCTFDNDPPKAMADEYQRSFKSIAKVAVSVEIGDQLQRLRENPIRRRLPEVEMVCIISISENSYFGQLFLK